MVQVFNECGLREESYSEPYPPDISKAFIEKHGREKTETLCRQIMFHFRDIDETKPCFSKEKNHIIAVDASVRDVLKGLAKQRGFSISSLVREALHCHLLKNVEPVRVMNLKPASTNLLLSPFEEKLLRQWLDETRCTFGMFLSTLASVTQPLLETDLSAQYPRQHILLYPDPEFKEKFQHSTKVYGYPAPSLFRQILAFCDRPFDPHRVQDRYLDWLTGGYAHALSGR